MNDPFPAYAPSEEHDLLRATVRELAEDKIAPAAADVDEQSRYPQEALDALTGAGLHAVHIPEAYGGEGADALATVIVIEEVARVCASSSLIPAVNKLGTVPVLLSASEDSPTRTVIFEDARIPADRMIGAEGTGFRTALATLDHTRITIAAQALGIAQGALDYAAGYVKQREQFGQPVASFEGVQFMLADMAMKLEAARQLTYHAAILSERAMQGEKQPGLTFASSAAKCFASDAAMEITTDAVQLLGGYGYVKDYPVERMMRDAKITQIYEGTNQIQRMVMARQLLKGDS